MVDAEISLNPIRFGTATLATLCDVPTYSVTVDPADSTYPAAGSVRATLPAG